MICGTSVKPWFEVCFECYNPVSDHVGKIAEPIVANKFMKEMKINRW